MSDHIDGPRQIGDRSADLTDLFAFTSPENPAWTVLAANVFPTCGVDAVFSNAINYSIGCQGRGLNFFFRCRTFLYKEVVIRLYFILRRKKARFKRPAAETFIRKSTPCALASINSKPHWNTLVVTTREAELHLDNSALLRVFHSPTCISIPGSTRHLRNFRRCYKRGFLMTILTQCPRTISR